MYGCAGPLQGLCTLALLQWFARGVLAGDNPAVETLYQPNDLDAENGLFSLPWLKQYNEDDTECELGRGKYTWRKSGLGSNINNMLSAWVFSLAVDGWSDISLISDKKQFHKLNCFNESEGLVSHGWGCLFSNIPHLCVFDTAQAWTNHMHSANVSDEDLHTADMFTIKCLRQRTSKLVISLRELDVDRLGALAASVMAKYLFSFMTPWLRHDVDAVIHAEKAVEGSPFLAIHVRRGDKLKHEAHMIAVEEYMKVAVAYVEEDTTPAGVDDIKAIWVASDDPTVVDEVRTLTPMYFPSVSSEASVFYFGKATGKQHSAHVGSTTFSQEYESFVYILADLEKLAAADVFVGTFSSNVGRLAVLMREGLGKPRNSSISLDKESWYPGRQRGLLLD